jgi:hypothetical protein
MGTLPSEAWLLIAAVIALTLLCMGYVASAMLRDFDRVCTLKRDVALLREKYAQRMRELAALTNRDTSMLDAGPTGEFDFIEPGQSRQSTNQRAERKAS